MPTISITSIEYSNNDKDGKPIIHIFGRDSKGIAKKIDVVQFIPYFYATYYPHITQGSLPKTAELDTSCHYRGIRGEDCIRIYTKSPGDVSSLRTNYEHHEADVLFTNRFQIDLGLKSGVSFPVQDGAVDVKDISPIEVDHPVRTCIVDIECSDAEGWPDPQSDPIICITCHDSFTETYTTFVLSDDLNSDIQKIIHQQQIGENCFNPDSHTILPFSNEKLLLKAFADYIRDTDPDVLTGWNINGFDMPYIVDRFEALKISPEYLARIPGRSRDKITVRGRQIFDLLSGYKKMHLTQKESYRLDAIAMEELGEHKVHFSGKISALSINTLVEYNFKDVELCVGINAKDDIVGFHMEIAKYVGCSLDKTLNSMPIIDNYILRKAHGRFVLPSKSHEKNAEDSFQGAVVFAPVLGRHKNVIVLDATSLYPMSMLTGNMSPDTKDPNGEICSPIGVRFKKHPDGLVREIQTEFFEERKRLKAERGKHKFGSREYKLFDMKQNVVKVLMNSYYGVSGNSAFRLHDREIGASVTAVGRALLEHNKKIIEEAGYTVIFGDTDSTGFPVESDSIDELVAIGKDLEKRINDSYPAFAKECLNADVSYFSVKFEKLYKTFFSGGRKKRYAGLLVWKEGKDADDIDITGYETKRSDTPAIVKITQKKLIEQILRGSDYQEIRKDLRDVVRKYLKGEYSLDEIGIPGGFSKDFSLYENKDAHIRGAEYANRYMGANFGRGSKPKRLYVKASPKGLPRTDVICFEYGNDVPTGFVIDRELMMEKTLKPPIERIFEGLGWDWNDFDVRKTNLSQFGIS